MALACVLSGMFFHCGRFSIMLPALWLWVGWSHFCLGKEPLSIQLVSGVTSVAPGQPFYLALDLKHSPGYHTYWKHPGTVGVPTSIKWTAVPRGFRMGEIAWPEPERTKMFTILAQGYDRDVVLPIPVYPPAKLTAGQKLRFEGQASWMCCASDCNPGYKVLGITLEVANGNAATVWQSKIDAELRRGISEMKGWASSAVIDSTSIQITLSPGPDARPLNSDEVKGLIYFTEDGVVDSNKPQEISLRSDGSLAIKTTLADTIPGGLKYPIKGVLLRPGGWLQDGSARAMRFLSERGNR
jgi:DsbC/DsbD-like thiol-disulfide interchange protein